MKTSDKLLNMFFYFVSKGMKIIPWLTVWTAERVFYLFPKFMRFLVDDYTSSRILSCVVGGVLPIIPELNGGDAILFYPLSKCVRYELLEYPEIAPIPLFEGRILALVIPKEKRLPQYSFCGYDEQGICYGSGRMTSHSKQAVTQIRKGIRVHQNQITWNVKNTRAYLTSFLMIHSSGKPHAAGYSQTRRWNYPDTTFLPHVVIQPDGTPLDKDGLSVMAMVVNTDGWVPEILVWQNIEPK